MYTVNNNVLRIRCEVPPSIPLFVVRRTNYQCYSFVIVRSIPMFSNYV